MKKLIWIFFLLSTIVLTFGACRVGRVTSSGGVDNVSQLQFVRGTTEKYSEGVDVYIDNNAPFKAKVDKVDSRTVKGNVYTIQKGNRHIKVEYKGAVLYERSIIIAIGETRKIQLP